MNIGKSQIFGGHGGNKFDDMLKIVGMNIRHGNQVDSIQVVYKIGDGEPFNGPYHGGHGGSRSSFTLEADEVLTKMEGSTNGQLLDQVTFHTSKGKVYGPYGTPARNPFSLEAMEIVAMFGNAGNLIDGIGAYYKD